MTDTLNLEIGNADLFHIGMRVKWDHNKEHFHTGSLIIKNLSKEDAQLEIKGYIGSLACRGYEIEWGMWAYDYYLVTETKEVIPVDIENAIFTLKTPVPFSKF